MGKPFKAQFFTNILLTEENGESSQVQFTKTYKAGRDTTNHAGEVLWNLAHSTFIESDTGHYYRSEIVTDFAIIELGEN